MHGRAGRGVDSGREAFNDQSCSRLLSSIYLLPLSVATDLESATFTYQHLQTMSISTAARQISHHWTGMHHFSIIPSIPLASSSRSPFRYSSTSTSTSTFPNPSRKIYAQAQPSAEAGFESIPPPMYSGPVDSASSIGKGKGKENHVVKEEPRRKVSIRSKKAAISMVRLSSVRVLCSQIQLRDEDLRS